MKASIDQILADGIESASRQSVSLTFRRSLQDLGFSNETMNEWDNLPDGDVSKNGVCAFLYRLGKDLAQRSANDTSEAYHNTRHTSEVVYCAGKLAQAQWPPKSDERRGQGLKLLVAMVGHDLEHCGVLPNGPVGAMERHSADIIAQAARKYGYPEKHRVVVEQLQDIIMGTEFVTGPKTNRDKLEQDPACPQAILRAMANDADVLPSLLPQTGPERGERLAEEWREHRHPMAEVVASPQGRLFFLRNTPLLSPAAQNMGLQSLINREAFCLAQRVRAMDQAKTAQAVDMDASSAPKI